MKTITRAQLEQALKDAGFTPTIHGNQRFFRKEYSDISASVHVIKRTLTIFPKADNNWQEYRYKTTTDLAHDLARRGHIDAAILF